MSIYHSTHCQRCAADDPQPEPDENAIRELLADYDHLIEQAQERAKFAFSLRYPQWRYAPDFDLDFSNGYIQARWVHHGDNDYEDFPLDYLWMNLTEIKEAEQIKADARAAFEAESQRKKAQEREQQERRELARLQAKYSP